MDGYQLLGTYSVSGNQFFACEICGAMVALIYSPDHGVDSRIKHTEWHTQHEGETP